MNELPVVKVWWRGGQWTLTESFFFSGKGRGGFYDADAVVVPKGFVFDLASVPRVLWPVIGPAELSLEAACVHDWLYATSGEDGRFSRKQADDLFRRMMSLYGVTGWKSWAAYRAVRLFGGLVWKGGKGNVSK